MGNILRDLRCSFRVLLQHPGFTAVALLSLALGIGATTTIFTVVNTVVLRPFPFKDPDRLMLLFERNLRGGLRNPTFETLLNWRKQRQIFEDMALAGLGFLPGGTVTLTGAGDAVRIQSHGGTMNLLPLLGVSLVIGRTFLPEDLDAAGSTTVVLSHDFWQRHFDRDPGVLGKAVTIEERKKTIIGVMPPRFWVLPRLKDVDAWLA